MELGHPTLHTTSTGFNALPPKPPKLTPFVTNSAMQILSPISPHSGDFVVYAVQQIPSPHTPLMSPPISPALSSPFNLADIHSPQSSIGSSLDYSPSSSDLSTEGGEYVVVYTSPEEARPFEDNDVPTLMLPSLSERRFFVASS